MDFWGRCSSHQKIIIAVLDPAIHVVQHDHHWKCQCQRHHVDARVKRGHDGQSETNPPQIRDEPK
uniref:Uncharacterized protein n=1 Tax=Magnetospirillum gryphiswaldense TaxID=55518 RepID=A4TW85_9PROT|nr:hypothetical protein MGR_1767 [Magnetospirillum gryphiswaldense MSR-1]